LYRNKSVHRKKVFKFITDIKMILINIKAIYSLKFFSGWYRERRKGLGMLKMYIIRWYYNFKNIRYNLVNFTFNILCQ